MQYVTMMAAFGIPCNRSSCGKWNLRREDFTAEDKFITRESEESPLKDYGIEKDKLVPYREYCVYNVADHVRAYCDMLYECKFDEMHGLFHECIADLECRKDIFMLVYGKMRTAAWFSQIDLFMEEEFGNAWVSYKNSIESVSKHISDQLSVDEALSKIQGVL